MMGLSVELIMRTIVRDSFDLPRTLFRPQVKFFVKSFSSTKPTPDELSFMVSYLISSCGLSPETALRASQKVHFQSAEQPDSVLTLLRNHGFNSTHISTLVRMRPNVLLSDPNNTLLPKLEFFQSIGLPAADLARILSSNPNLLKSSLNNQLIPAYNYLKSVILLDDRQVRKSLKTTSPIFERNLEKIIVPKIAVLRELGVPASNLPLLVTRYPYALVQNVNQFERAVKEVLEMGFNPSEQKFLCALQVMARNSKSTWDRKLEVYRKCGWSEDDFQRAFKKLPLCMGLSEKRILSVMDIFVDKVGWEPSAIARLPMVLLYSLKKRIIPRCLVVKSLLLKGLIEKDVSLSTIFVTTDKYFLDKFVAQYVVDVPQLLDVFNGKVVIAELGFRSEEICEVKLS